MDAVYILGSGSLSENEEIKYSIRSLETNMLDLRNIYIIGDDPGFLKDVKYFSMRDASKEKYVNAFSKIKFASSIAELSEEFLLMNDDFFLLQPFTGADWPFYALKGSNGGSCGIHSFHMHCPIRFKKEFYLNLPFDPMSKACKSPRTFYANFYKAPPTFHDDFILRSAEGCRDFDEQIKNWPCFSIGDTAMLYPPFRKWLDVLFPTPSRFENLEK
jgi:hypothetical protein